MNKYILLSSIAVLLFATSPARSQKSPSPDVVISRVAAKLATVKTLGYKYTFEYNYPGRATQRLVAARAYLELQPVDQKDGFKFQFIGDDRSSVYNGSERFITDKKSKKLYVDNSPSFDSVGDIFLQNSPLSLKYALPKLGSDKKIIKKLASTREYYLLEFSLTKSAITAGGEIQETRADQNATYVVTVDRKTFLPVAVLQTNDKNDESLKTSFSDITEKPAMPENQSWYFSSYKDYQLEKKEKLTLIQTGNASPDFKLAGFGSDSSISLDQYKGKLVLLEFWIAHCGFCITAVPKINAIAQRFRDKDLQVISINMHDPTSTIEFFKNKNNPQYTILMGGDSVANAFGVEAFPAIVLVDKSGKVVYSSSGMDEKVLEAAIVANL
jgi:thiol-disulfide isomerase/thioredoxin